MAARTGSVYRRRRAAAIGLLVAVAVSAFLILRSPSGEERRLTPAAGTADGRYDPLAYEADRREEFEKRAAAGLSHVLYAKSPGGAFASARRTARWRPVVDRAARRGRVDPNLVEAILMLESAGRPDVIAGNDPEAASGLSQILAGTAVQLLGMRVDLRATRDLTPRIAAADARGDRKRAARLRAQRRRVDDRFNPARAIAGTVRYVALAKKRFGREDLAIASYHMGIGNLETVLRRFSGADPATPVGAVVGDGDLSYARVYFDSTPLLHARAYQTLASFGDDSSTYLWRVLAAREMMRLYREKPPELRRLAALHQASDWAERVLRPAAAKTGTPVAPPPRAGRLGITFRPGASRPLLPEALSTLLYMGVGTRDIGRQCCLIVTAHPTTGYEFDVSRRYRDQRQAAAFQFMLDRLTALNLIAWRRDANRIRVVASSDARRLLPEPRRLARDALLRS